MRHAAKGSRHLPLDLFHVIVALLFASLIMSMRISGWIVFSLSYFFEVVLLGLSGIVLFPTITRSLEHVEHDE